MKYTKGLEFYLKNAPRSYPMTTQQAKMKAVARSCGVKKGISKSELMTLMKECVGPGMRTQSHE